MLEGTKQEETSDVGYSRNQPPALEDDQEPPRPSIAQPRCGCWGAVRVNECPESAARSGRFDAAITTDPLVVTDNADEAPKWLPDRLAVVGTDGAIKRRILQR